ncbi:RNA 3'-terminal phosphate cyclase-like protein [Hetaerina americana]|uniref:RNA 3'-terminal phosphate cyclase-like protein n=1 Tax=Hetaerina americana TaxID=62018 RepID=UPI003A7F4AD9
MRYLEMSEIPSHIIQYEGSNYFRIRLVLSLLSGKSITISQIRHNDINPGLSEAEVNVVRLLDKITNGSHIHVNETGTELNFRPGLLVGGKVHHVCSNQRGIGYYLEVLLCLGPFCKVPLDVVLRGATNHKLDPSIEAVRSASLPVIKKFFNFDNDIELKVVKRALNPNADGEVIFKCPISRKLKPVQITKQGKVKRIRGIAFTTKVSPAIGHRMVFEAKRILMKCIPDVYINTDHSKGVKSGTSPGFGIILVAETTEGVFFTAEAMSSPASPGSLPAIPEDLGREASLRLLEEIHNGGCVSSCSQSLAILLMSLGEKDVSKFVTGPLTPYSIATLRHLVKFFALTFQIEPIRDEDEDLDLGASKVGLTCVGVGLRNLNKRVL